MTIAVNRVYRDRTTGQLVTVASVHPNGTIHLVGRGVNQSTSAENFALEFEPVEEGAEEC